MDVCRAVHYSSEPGEVVIRSSRRLSTTTISQPGLADENDPPCQDKTCTNTPEKSASPMSSNLPEVLTQDTWP